MNIQRDFGAAIVPKGFHGVVMADLGRGIIGGTYPENSILPRDAELLERYGVSRTVLREALKTLAAKGLIQAKAKIGTRVLPRSNWNLFDAEILRWHAEAGVVDAKFLLDLQEMRVALESEAARLAAMRRTDEQLAALYYWVDRMGEPTITAGLFLTNDLQFHMTIAEAAQNPFMRTISALIEVAMVEILAVSAPILNTEQHAIIVAKHRAIADAIGRRDPEGARAAMLNVIQEGIDRVVALTGNE